MAKSKSKAVDPDAVGFIGGVSTENAKRALRAADDADVAQWRVRVVPGGFEAPQAVVDRYQELLEADWQPDPDAETPRGLTDASLADAEKATTKVKGAGVTEAPVDGTEPAGTEPGVTAAPESDDTPADNEDWTHERLNDFASTNNIELAKNLNKPDKVAAILAALNEKE